MEKLVISGSSKLEDKVKYWVDYFENKGYQVLDYPRLIENENYERDLPDIYKSFYNNLEETDIFFLMNEDKNGIKGYVGASAIAELTYAVVLNLIHNKNIKIYILQEPDESLGCYDEIKFWLEMKWISIFEKESDE